MDKSTQNDSTKTQYLASEYYKLGCDIIVGELEGKLEEYRQKKMNFEHLRSRLEDAKGDFDSAKSNLERCEKQEPSRRKADFFLHDETSWNVWSFIIPIIIALHVAGGFLAMLLEWGTADKYGWLVIVACTLFAAIYPILCALTRKARTKRIYKREMKRIKYDIESAKRTLDEKSNKYEEIRNQYDEEYKKLSDETESYIALDKRIPKGYYGKYGKCDRVALYRIEKGIVENPEDSNRLSNLLGSSYDEAELKRYILQALENEVITDLIQRKCLIQQKVREHSKFVDDVAFSYEEITGALLRYANAR